ncbi:SpvB/TcaC N-terminal domain-containing protein [Pseudoalteromonas aurantia]|uniref:Fibronectin type-III domain-containing protein n=1 Tax=Pseudoalteromonas aurantia 208 TaxID=1314867 RepID=A0ABR9ED61_9GAMM|nr:SpvB/TcaC N-terminal domain-containing protein [Pseudoalteromonas aurantia]MBE0368299.1 hypothetical protein [Pseudoalteromonas aurantia 208]
MSSAYASKSWLPIATYNLLDERPEQPAKPANTRHEWDKYSTTFDINAQGQRVLTWYPQANVTQYKVMYKVAGNKWQEVIVTDNQFVLANEVTGDVEFRVVGCSSAQLCQDYANEVTVSLNGAGDSAPAYLSLPQVIDAGQPFQISWANVPNAAMYRIQRSTAINGNYETVYTGNWSYGDAAQSFDHPSLADGKYCFKVNGVDAQGSMLASSNAICTVIGTRVLNAPSDVNQVAVDFGVHKISWRDVPGAVTYEIERESYQVPVAKTFINMRSRLQSVLTRHSTQSEDTHWKTVARIQQSTFEQVHTIDTFDLHGQQNYRIKACDNKNQCTSASSISYTVPAAHVVGAQPTNIQAVQASSSQINFNWNSVKDANYYALTMSRRGSAWESRYANIRDNNYTVTQHLEGEYNFRVEACIKARGNDFCAYPRTIDTSFTKVITGVDNRTPQFFDVPEKVTQSSQIRISWKKPKIDLPIKMYEVQGELKGAIAKYVFTADANDYSVLYRPASELAPGREYCYKVRAWFTDHTHGPYTPTMCTVVGFKRYDAVTHFTMVQIGTKDFKISWQAPSIESSDIPPVKYLLEQQTYDPGRYTPDTVLWQPVYYGSETQLHQQFSDFHKYYYGRTSHMAYRVSACDAQGVCGNHNRVFYRNFNPSAYLDSPSNVHLTPACLNVPERVNTGEKIAISWCEAQALDVKEYELYGELQNLIGVYPASNLPKITQTLMNVERGPHAKGREYCYKVLTVFNDGSKSDFTHTKCAVVDKVVYEKPAEFDVAQQPNKQSEYTLTWSHIAGAANYQLERMVGVGVWQTAACQNMTQQVVAGKTYKSCSVTVSASDYIEGWNSVVYRVAACDTAGTCGNFARARIYDLSGFQLSSNGVDLSWPAINGAVSYTIESANCSANCHDNANLNWQAWATLDGNQSSYTLPAGNGRTYRIKICFSYDKCSLWNYVIEPSTLGFSETTTAALPDAKLVDITAPTAGNVGTATGSASVSGGAASYRIPMPLPPGRNGVQPSVSLNYSSRSGNGIAGVGFALSAGSQISRCAATYAQDSFTQNPQYNDNDKLCLDGQRLINVSGLYGQDNTVYRTELESLVRVTQSGKLNSGSVSFTAEYANGTTAYFGQKADSRVTHSGRTQTNTWLISHQHDATANNYMHYTYTDYGVAEKLLTEIAYTGNSESEKGQQTVQFEYEGKNASRSGYMAGGYYESTQRLKRIVTYNNTSEINSLTLTYKTSAATSRELIESVQLCANTTCLPATSFTWQDTAMTVKNEHLDIQTLTTITQNAPVADRNGDGARDWPGKYINAEGVSVNNTHPTNSCVYDGGAVQNCHQKTADLNLDGYSDQLDLVLSGTGRNLQYTLNNKDGSVKAGTTDIQVEALANILAVQDYNGDSYPDVLILNKFVSTHADQVLIYYHSGNITAPYTAANQSVLMTLDKNIPEMPHTTMYNIVPMGDLDGNGLADFYVTDGWDRRRDQAVVGQAPINALYFTHASENTVSLQRGTGLPDSGSYGSDGGSTQYTRFYFFADVNGDGLQDWLGWKSPNNRSTNKTRLYVRYNQGGTFSDFHDTELNMPMREVIYKEFYGSDDEVRDAAYEPKYANALQIGDIDNDGKEEILYPATVTVSHCIEATIDSGFTKGEVCGDQFDNALEKIGAGNFAYVKTLDTRYDRSIYQYKAIRLSNGAFSAHTTGFYGSRNHSMLVDGQGDGLVDMIFNYGYRCDSSGSLGCNFSTAPPSGFAQGKVNVSRNYGSGSGETGSDYAPSDMLTSVTNGVGHQSGWAYRPLSSGLDTKIAGAKKLYEKGTNYVKGHQNFASSMYVVTTFSQDDGIGGKQYTDYAYRGAVYNAQGRGFMGFERIIEQNRTLGVVSQSDFKQVFPMHGKVFRQASFLPDDFSARTAGQLDTLTNETSAISFAQSTWQVNSSHTIDGVKHVYLQSKLQVQNDIDDKSEVTRTDYSAVDIDACGNVTNSTNTVQDSWGTYKTTTNTTFSAYIGCSYNGVWWPNIVDSVSVTKAAVTSRHTSDPGVDATLDKASTIKTTFTEYATNRKPTTVKVEGLEGTAKSGEGSTTTTVFNIYGLPTSVNKTANVRNSAGKWVAQTRPVTMTYSKDGKANATDGYFPLTVTNAKGHQVFTQVNPATGLPTLKMQQVGASAWVTSTIQYDNLNRPYSSKVDGAPIQYTAIQSVVGDTHAPAKTVMMIKQLSAGTPESRIYQDKLGRTLRVATQSFDGTWAYQDTTYDGLGRTTFESMPYKANGSAVGTRYSGFDVLGRPTTKTVAQQCTSTTTGTMTVTYGYSGLDTTIDVTENCLGLSLGQMSRTYNSLKQLVATKDALDNHTYYGYNSQGLPAVIQDAGKNQIKAYYNALGHKVKVEDPNQGTSTFAYNGFGELQIDARNGVQSLTYLVDTLGRVTKRTATGESDLSYGFDAGNGYGQMTSSSGNGVSHSYGFDSFGRPTTHTVSGDGKSYTNTTFYDGNYGRVKGVRYPNNLTLEYTYNNLGYQESIKNAASDYVYQTVSNRDILGNITQHALGNGLAQTTLYSTVNGQMTSVTTKDGNDQLMSLQYTGYDGFGNLNAMTVSTGSIGNQHTFSESYVYDGLHRLTSNSVNGIETISYGYDALGNLTKKTDYASEYKYDTSLAGFSGGGSNAVKQVKKNGAWVGFSYDARGNMIKGDGLSSATYNALDKPVSITKHGVTTEFMYGPDHMRYRQIRGKGTAGETHMYYAGAYEEDVKNGKTTWRAYIGDVAVVSQGEGESATIRYTHRDRLGSARLFTDKNGNVLAERNFDPFGKPKEASGQQKLPAMLDDMDTATTMRGFTDHEHLDEQQLIHMNGRVYDYNLGRFMSVDPVIQAPGNSQSINPYSYIMNNPLAGTDPSGYCSTGTSIKGKNAVGCTVTMGNIEPSGGEKAAAYADASLAAGWAQKSNGTQQQNASVNTTKSINDLGGQGEKAKEGGSKQKGNVDWLAVQKCQAGVQSCGGFDIHSWVNSAEATQLGNYGDIKSVYDGLFGPEGRWWDKSLLASSITAPGFMGSPLIRMFSVSPSTTMLRQSWSRSGNFNIDPNKYNYFFGRVTTGKQSNIVRSAQNLKDLTTLGIETEAQLYKVFAKTFSQGKFIKRQQTEHGVSIMKELKIGNRGAIQTSFFYKGGNFSSKPNVSTIIPKVYN